LDSRTMLLNSLRYETLSFTATFTKAHNYTNMLSVTVSSLQTLFLKHSL
jgi:hypothetical protein